MHIYPQVLVDPYRRLHLTGPKSTLIIAHRAHSSQFVFGFGSGFADLRFRGTKEALRIGGRLVPFDPLCRPFSSLRRGEQSKGSPEQQRASRRTRPSFFLFSFSLFPTSSSRLTLAAALQLSMTHAPLPPLSPFVPPPSASPSQPSSPPFSRFYERGEPSPWRVLTLFVYLCTSSSLARACTVFSDPPLPPASTFPHGVI